ncbi:MAG TPA: FAD-dependent monooxygenase [Stellaceae bacterium]|jgi:2-polyprenyl-6-methoxyphenol hydroxylase-like FAD-dependent oxidoreductase
MRAIPIVIVGGGPVGMVLAMNLAFLGVPSTILNTEASSRWHPKGNTHNARTMEHYRRLGIAKALRKVGLPPDHPTDVAYFTTLNGWELARHLLPSEQEKMARLAAAAPTDQVPEPLFRANQMYVEAELFRQLKAVPQIAARYAWRCAALAEERDGTFRVTIEEVASGRRDELIATYVVGCDGGHSIVRQWLGIGYSGERPSEQAYGSGATCSSHVSAPALYGRVLRKHKRCWHHWAVNPTVRGLIQSLDGAGEFLFNTRIKTIDEPPDPQHIARTFLACVGEEVPFAFLGHFPWTAGQAAVADSFGRGKVWLAGDAVHLFTPTGGFGMNTGIDDAANLAWKLAAMVEGWGGPHLLATYEAERRPIAFRNTGMAKRFSLDLDAAPVDPEMLEDSAAGAAARARTGGFFARFGEEFASIGIQLGARYDGSRIVISDGTASPPDDPTVYVPSACPGGRAPHLFLGPGESLFDHFGRGFTLLCLAGDADARPLTRAAQARRVPVAVFDVPLREGRELYEADLALIRPDQHVAWRGNRLPDDCDALVARLTGWA